MFTKYIPVNNMEICARIILFGSYVVRLDAKYSMCNAKCLMQIVGWTNVAASRSMNLVANIVMGIAISWRQNCSQYTEMSEGLGLAKVGKNKVTISKLWQDCHRESGDQGDQGLRSSA